MKNIKAIWLLIIFTISILPLQLLAESEKSIFNINDHSSGILPSSFCLAPNTPSVIAKAAVARRLFNQLEYSLVAQTREQMQKAQFNDSNRWSETATDGDGLQQGDPITLTWSIVPDGTSIYGYSGESASPSNLQAFLDSIYGNETVWLSLFEQVFARWSELTGINYVYEPNDDGDPWLANYIAPGQLSMRGDIRIAGHRIDGDYGILAYNFLPDFGDMIIDSDDNFFNNTINNSIGLRNVVSHEHGHGLGLNHVCPLNQTKLMEPFLTTVFDGPQHDDILAAQRGYGDSLEYNDDITTATNIKPLEFGAGSDVINLSLDSNADVDVYSIDVEADSSLNVIVTPIGFSYLNGPQFADGSCSTGEITSSLDIQDLWFEILDTDGTTVLASVDDSGLGLEEVLNELALSSGAGTYYIRIRGDDIDQIQLYELSITVQDNIQEAPEDNPGSDNPGIPNNGVFSSGFD